MDEVSRHFRKHTRIRTFDYRSNDAYFVTIVTGERKCVFGSIANGIVKASVRGLVVGQCWNDIPIHHPFVELDAFTVMPNHVHGILMFVGNEQQIVAATPASPLRPHGPTSHSLGAVIGSFKSAVSRQINRLRAGAATRLWQPNYYEHVIRHDRALDLIREYIVTNPQRWESDAENPWGNASDDFQQFIRSIDIAPSREGGDAGVAATR